MGEFSKIHSLIAGAASGVIEQIAQQPIMAVFEDTRIPGDILVKMDFTSKFKGTFWFVFDKTFCIEIAAKFSSMPVADITDEILMDIMKEICNMITSAILQKFDSKGNYKAGVPEVSSGDAVFDSMGNIPVKAQNFLFKVGEKSFNIYVNLDLK